MKKLLNISKKFILYIFLFNFFFIETTFSDDLKKIDIHNSVIHFIEEKNSWRTDIKSILITENQKIYLVKECRAEKVGKHPFLHIGRYEFLGIVEDDKTHFIRTSATGDKKSNLQLNAPIKNKKYIIKSNVEYLNFEEVHKIVSSGKINNIYCEIEYYYEGIKYNLITKCEYINYNTKKSDEKYLQPIMGYVPFKIDNKLRYGYVALYIGEKENGYLEFLLNKKSNLFIINPDQNFVKLYVKKILNTMLFFYKQNNFTELVSIKESKIKFFQYN